MLRSRSRTATPLVAQFLWSLALALGAGSGNARAEFALLQPEKDGTLIENPAGALSNGSGPAIFAGRISSSSNSARRALIAFDVAAVIPPGSTVTEASLWLSLSSTNAGPVRVSLHSVFADWGEGASIASGGGGASSVPGDSTWLHRFYDGVFWGRPGGDYEPVPRADAVVDQPGVYVWGTTQDMVADVQSWLDHPETAYGWLLMGDETHPTTVKRFDSREHPESASRPLLEVEYVPPCSPDPAGPGYWRRQCSSLVNGGDAGAGTLHGLLRPEPRFGDWVVPCAQRLLSDLGLPEIGACEALLSPPPRNCRERAEEKLAVLVLNVCAGRLQTSCPVGPDEGDCSAASLGDLLLEISALIRDGDCRRASCCGGSLD
jgi:hypothetical protein